MGLSLSLSDSAGRCHFWNYLLIFVCGKQSVFLIVWSFSFLWLILWVELREHRKCTFLGVMGGDCRAIFVDLVLGLCAPGVALLSQPWGPSTTSRSYKTWDLFLISLCRQAPDSQDIAAVSLLMWGAIPLFYAPTSINKKFRIWIEELLIL